MTGTHEREFDDSQHFKTSSTNISGRIAQSHFLNSQYISIKVIIEVFSTMSQYRRASKRIKTKRDVKVVAAAVM